MRRAGVPSLTWPISRLLCYKELGNLISKKLSGHLHSWTFPTKKKIKQLDCFVPAHLHLAEDRKKEACSLKCQQCFLPVAGGYRWGGESQLLAPRIVWAAEEQWFSIFISVSSCCHIGNIGITQTKWSLKDLQGCLAPFCLKWKMMNAALVD